MMHLSRLSEELVLWSSADFGFIDLSDGFCTGSSIMPQKKNPDVPELVRGKTGRVYGNLMALLTLMKSLPLAYNKDMQEDKEPLFDTIDTVKGSLKIFADMIAQMKVNGRAHARGGGHAASPPPPTWPTTWCARGCRSARPTRWSARRCATAWRTARTSPS